MQARSELPLASRNTLTCLSASEFDDFIVDGGIGEVGRVPGQRQEVSLSHRGPHQVIKRLHLPVAGQRALVRHQGGVLGVFLHDQVVGAALALFVIDEARLHPAVPQHVDDALSRGAKAEAERPGRGSHQRQVQRHMSALAAHGDLGGADAVGDVAHEGVQIDDAVDGGIHGDGVDHVGMLPFSSACAYTQYSLLFYHTWRRCFNLVCRKKPPKSVQSEIPKAGSPVEMRNGCKAGRGGGAESERNRELCRKSRAFRLWRPGCVPAQAGVPCDRRSRIEERGKQRNAALLLFR